MEREFGISRCKLAYIGWINKVRLDGPENHIQYLVTNHNGKGYKTECIYLYNSITLLHSRN